MAVHALGEVKPSSITTGLRATNNVTNASIVLDSASKVSISNALNCQAICFQALSANTGSVFICDTATPTLTLNVLAEVVAPSGGSRPSFTFGNPAGNATINAANMWIVPAVSGEGVRVSIVR